MRKVTEKMLKRRVLNVAASLATAQSYLSQVFDDALGRQVSSCNVLRALRDATKAADEMHEVVMRIWHEEKGGA